MDIGQILGQLGFDWKMALFNLVNFLIVFLILKKFLFSRVTQVLDQRRSMVAESMSKIEQGEKAKSEAERKAGEILDAARNESDKILEASREEAVQTSLKIRSDATEEAEKLKAKAKLDAEKMREEKLASLNKDIIDVVLSATQKVAGNKVDAKEINATAETVLKEIK